MDTPQMALVFVVSAFVLFGVWRLATRGFKGSLFGGRIEETYGEVSGVSGPMSSSSLKVHTIEAEGTPDIGLELTLRTMMSWEIKPVRLTREQALELIRLLERASGGRPA